jgi:hypothetical protein
VSARPQDIQYGLPNSRLHPLPYLLGALPGLNRRDSRPVSAAIDSSLPYMLHRALFIPDAAVSWVLKSRFSREYFGDNQACQVRESRSAAASSGQEYQANAIPQLSVPRSAHRLANPCRFHDSPTPESRRLTSSHGVGDKLSGVRRSQCGGHRKAVVHKFTASVKKPLVFWQYSLIILIERFITVMRRLWLSAPELAIGLLWHSASWEHRSWP